MLMTMDLTLSLDAELANLLADYDAFLAAEDTLLAGDPGMDSDDDVADDFGDDDTVVDDTGDDTTDDDTGETGEAPPVTAGEAPADPVTDPAATDPVDQGGVDDSGDPAEVAQTDPGVEPQVDFSLASDELAFDLDHALQVGRKLGGEFFDFA